jgi:hypothetical protein
VVFSTIKCCVSFRANLFTQRFSIHSQTGRALATLRGPPHIHIQTMSPELITGFQVATLTLTLTFLLELSCSIPEVFQLRSDPKGKRLYRACITANLVNNLLIGPPTYALATNFFVSRSEEYSAVRSIASALGLIVAHALGYHYAHRQMHEPSMYWAHK